MFLRVQTSRSRKPTQRRRQSELLGYKADLVALKKKGYSCQAMADFLATVHRVPVSRKTVFDFLKANT